MVRRLDLRRARGGRTVTGAYAYARAFKKNCPSVRLIETEMDELARLFQVAQHEAEEKGFERGMDAAEAMDRLSQEAL